MTCALHACRRLPPLTQKQENYLYTVTFMPLCGRGGETTPPVFVRQKVVCCFVQCGLEARYPGTHVLVAFGDVTGFKKTRCIIEAASWPVNPWATACPTRNTWTLRYACFARPSCWRSSSMPVISIARRGQECRPSATGASWQRMWVSMYPC